MHPDPLELRARLAQARLLLLFTPELAGGREPLEVLEAAAPWIDVVQIRPKPPGGASRAPCEARATRDWALRTLELDAVRRHALLVTVDDRVDVARWLWAQGLAGVHLGTEDAPPGAARACLGPGPLVGLSTHDLAAVAAASDLPIDYLGFGPVHATGTKGYARGLGAEAAWIAAEAATRPVFPIGGVDAVNAAELARVGRAAVGAAILGAPDPAAAARAIRAALAASRP
ncbi:MAG: thiamine phosphate synthase [Planctomycetes bacterium]|nr:thiamine phosphate synthase [Planctomycetota bacterium]